MQDQELSKPNVKGPAGVKRRLIGASPEGFIKAERLRPDLALPLLIRPGVPGVSLMNWVENNLEFVEAKLLDHGAVLFRNFKIEAVADFERFIEVLSPELLDYSYRSTPRTQVCGKIYTSTEYPAHQFIPLHNEMSYSRHWPMKIWFFCIQAAEQGGETPTADSRRVFERIAPEIRERFMNRKVMYVRNYGEGLDLSWQEVFQTTDRREVERFCRTNGIGFEWLQGDQLTTRQVCQAVASHPVTGEKVWFNQAHLFHLSSLGVEIRESLLSAYKEEALPRNAYYGDGAAIEDSVLDEIRDAYRQEAVTFQWQKGDILMLDNMLTAHGRNPYAGARKIVVGMAEPFSTEDS